MKILKLLPLCIVFAYTLLVFGCARPVVRDKAQIKSGGFLKSSRLACTGLVANWATVDSNPSSVAFRFNVDNVGAFYVTGSDWGNGSAWITRKSVDQGRTWAIFDSFTYPSATSAVATFFKQDSANNMFIGGYAYVDGKSRWIIRKSMDGGSTWNIIDDFQYSTGQSSSAITAIADTAGNLYVGGNGADASGRNHVLIRKSTNQGRTWFTLLDYQYAAQQGSNFAFLDTDLDKNFYLGISGRDALGVSHWVVRKSTDNGESWSTIHDLQHEGRNSFAYGFGKDNFGNLYLPGYVSGASGKYIWMVRKSIDHGVNWSTIDMFQYEVGQNSTARDFISDNFGNLYVLGIGVDASSKWHAIIRTSTDGGATWRLHDDFSSDSGTQLYRFYKDVFGSLYVVGGASGGDSVVRKLRCE